jgi:hypothetical protein
LDVHRLFYDAIETGDADLMRSLWVDHADTSCIHPAAEPLRGTEKILRSWSVLMANVGYIQFFLTDVDVQTFPRGSSEPETAVIVCTENILSGSDSAPSDSFNGGRALCTSILVRTSHGAGGWKFWSRHASPIADQFQEGTDV